jgi:hypothetical protein
MNDNAVLSHDLLGAEYLLQLQALASELSVAMDAIGANSLTGLQESVARQEMLCSVVANMAKSIREKVRESGQAPLVVSDSLVQQRIGEASEAIRQLNLQYAALLKHSGRSIALLASLCRSHTGQFQEARGLRSKRQTWSCEM